MASGNNAKLQFGLETVYADGATPDTQVKFSSEGFKLNLSKKDEGLLTGGKLTGRSYTMGKKVEGSFSALARPDDVGLLLGSAFGAEATALVVGSTGAYKHTFTIADSNPSLTFLIDKIVQVYEYTGCVVNTLGFSTASEDYLKLDVAVVGKDEGTGTLASLSPSPLTPFKFSNAVIKVNGVELEAKSVKFDFNNNLDSSTQTTSTGINYRQPEAMARDIKVDAEVIYDTATNTLRENFFKIDELVSIEITFTSASEIEEDYNYKMVFTVPYATIEDASPTVSGANLLTYNLQMKAVEGVNPVKVELINARATDYI